HRLHEVNLFDRRVERGSLVAIAYGDVDRPELCPDSTFAKPRNVCVQIFLPLADIELREVDRPSVAQLPGEIVVAIDEQTTAVEFSRLVRQNDRLAICRWLFGVDRGRHENPSRN